MWILICDEKVSFRYNFEKITVFTTHFVPRGAISRKLLGGKLVPKLVYFVLKKELLSFSEKAPKDIAIHKFISHVDLYDVNSIVNIAYISFVYATFKPAEVHQTYWF